jgi:hypothetical protein
MVTPPLPADEKHGQGGEAGQHGGCRQQAVDPEGFFDRRRVHLAPFIFVEDFYLRLWSHEPCHLCAFCLSACIRIRRIHSIANDSRVGSRPYLAEVSASPELNEEYSLTELHNILLFPSSIAFTVDKWPILQLFSTGHDM